MMKDIDTDGDGTISKSELAKANETEASKSSNATSSANGEASSVDNLFKPLDADGDGAISKSELSSFMEKAGTPTGRPQRATHARGLPPGPPPDAGSAEAGDSSNFPSSTSSTQSDPADTNRNGTVSAEERMAFASRQLLATLQRTGSLANDNASPSGIDMTN
jgi:hypothetical protein